MQVVLLLLGTLVLSSLVLTVSADTEIYSEKLDLYNKKKILFIGEKTEDSPLELIEARNFRDENSNFLSPQKQLESGRFSFLGLKFGQYLADKCSGKSSFNIPLLNQLLTSNGLGPLTGTSTLTTNILNLLLLANGDLEIATLNQILQGLGITPIPVPGNTLDQETIDRIIEQVKCGTVKPETVNPDRVKPQIRQIRPMKPKECESLNICLEFIGLSKVTFDGDLTRHLLIKFLNQNGPIDSDTLDTFLICLRIEPNVPDPISVIDHTILSQILNALRIPNKGCEVATSSSALTIKSAAMAALGSLLVAAVPVAIGLLSAYFLLDKKSFIEDDEYSDDIVPFVLSNYSPLPTYIPPPILNVPTTYGTPQLVSGQSANGQNAYRQHTYGQNAYGQNA